MTDWNEKLALFLLGLSATARAHDPAREGETRLPAGLLDPEKEKDLRARFEQAWTWLEAGSDHASLPAPGAKAPSVDWLKTPEVTHPLCASRHKPQGPLSAERVQGAIAAALDEIASRASGDPKRHALWLWRRLPERLAELEGGLGADWFRYPADPRAPHLTAWQQIAAAAALASAGSEPALIAVGVELDLEAQGARPEDVAAAAMLRSHLSFLAARALAELAGPDTILMPSLSQFPCTDAWLAEAGVLDAPKEASCWGFPGIVIALVPASRAEELGKACVAAVKDGWKAVHAPVREALAKALGKPGDWQPSWDRQADAAVEAWWTITPVEEDSTGAGALLPSRDIAGYEKAIKQRRDASGAEAPGKGAYLGLWSEAARASAEARRMTGGCAAYQPRPRCTCCREREAMASQRAAEAWDKARATFKDLLAEGDSLCAVCATARLSSSLSAGRRPAAAWDPAGAPIAVLAMSADGLASLLRAGDSKEGATLRSVLHTDLPGLLQKARSRWRDALDVQVTAGPGRALSASEALAAWALSSVRSEVSNAGGAELSLCGDELLVMVPAARALDLALKLREAWRRPFVMTTGPRGPEHRLHPGPASTLSCALCIVPADAPMAAVAGHARKLLQRASQETWGRDCVVVELQRDRGRGWLMGGKWDDAMGNLAALVSRLRGSAEREAVFDVALDLGVALTNSDLDRPKQEVRAALLRAAVARLLDAAQAEEAEGMARAMLSLVDQNAAAALDPDGNHGLDGLRIAAFLAEGNA